MPFSWKSVVLLAFASVAIQYTAMRTFSTKPFGSLCSRGARPSLSTDRPSVNYGHSALGGTGQEMPDGYNDLPSASSSASATISLSLHNIRRRTQILILATTRSGSSFVGQLLNPHPRGHSQEQWAAFVDAPGDECPLLVFYMFEPLYHFQSALLPRLAQSHNPAEKRVMLGLARDLLQSLFHCHLSSLERYIRSRPANHATDKLFRRGAICEAALGLVEQGLVLGEEGECVMRCAALNVLLAAKICWNRHHMAVKTFGIPHVSELRALVEDPTVNLK